MNKLNDLALDLFERTVINVFEICEVDHNTAFIKSAFCSILNALFLLFLVEKSKIEKLLERAID